MQAITKPMVRKQYLISPEMVEKLSQLAEEKNVSAAEIVRRMERVRFFSPTAMDRWI